MLYSFKLHKENEKVAGILSILEGLGSVVLQLTTCGYEPAEPAFSDRWMVNHIIKQIKTTYAETSFITLTSGSRALEYTYRQFEARAIMDPKAARELVSRYQVTLLAGLGEDCRYTKCCDYVSCDALRLICDEREMFSSKRISVFGDVSLKLLMPDTRGLEFYLLYEFTTVLSSEPVYNILLLVFRPTQLRLQQIEKKQIMWSMSLESPIRYFYRQRPEASYVHPLLGKYLRIEDPFYRGDAKNSFKSQLELYFTQECCEKQEYVRIAEAVRGEFFKEADPPYGFKASETVFPSDFAEVEPPSLDSEGQWHRFSCQVSGQRYLRDGCDVKQAVIAGTSILPRYHTQWLYDQPELKSLKEDVVLVSARCNEPMVNYEWRHPFLGLSSGRATIGFRGYTLLGGSRVTQLRQQFYVMKTERLPREWLDSKVVHTDSMVSLFTLERKVPIRGVKLLAKPPFSTHGKHVIGWISTTVLKRYVLLPVEHVLVKVGNQYGCLLPNSLTAEELIVFNTPKSVEAIALIEIYPEQTAYLTQELLELLQQAELTYQEIRWIHRSLYQRNRRLLKDYLANPSPPICVGRQQMLMSPVLRLVSRYRPNQGLLAYVAAQFEQQSESYPIGIRTTPIFSSRLQEDEALVNVPMDRVVLVMRAMKGLQLVAVRKCPLAMEQAYLATTMSTYLVLSDKLKNTIGSQRVTLVTCPYITKKLFSSGALIAALSEFNREGIRLPARRGFQSGVRNYFEAFSRELPVQFKQSEEPLEVLMDSYRIGVSQSVSGKTKSLLDVLDRLVSQGLEQAGCSLYSLLHSPLYIEHLLHLKRAFLKHLDCKQQREEIEKLLRSGDSSVKHPELMQFALSAELLP